MYADWARNARMCVAHLRMQAATWVALLDVGLAHGIGDVDVHDLDLLGRYTGGAQAAGCGLLDEVADVQRPLGDVRAKSLWQSPLIRTGRCAVTVIPLVAPRAGLPGRAPVRVLHGRCAARF